MISEARERLKRNKRSVAYSNELAKPTYKIPFNRIRAYNYLQHYDEWLETNTTGKFWIGLYCIIFEDHKDAMLFKLSHTE